MISVFRARQGLLRLRIHDGWISFRRTADYLTDEGHTVEENMTARGGAKRDIAGQRFGRLTAQRRVPPPDGAAQNDYWLCRCDCGNERTVLASNLLRGHTRSCGCLKQRDLTGQHINMLTVLEKSDQFATRGKRKPAGHGGRGTDGKGGRACADGEAREYSPAATADHR